MERLGLINEVDTYKQSRAKATYPLTSVREMADLLTPKAQITILVSDLSIPWKASNLKGARQNATWNRALRKTKTIN